MSAPFPADLPDLLRLACGQGQMRLNVGFGARANGRKHQANLANAGQGWTIDYDEDSLEAITKVLRARFGAMLERQRNPEPLPSCPADEGWQPPQQIDLEEAIAAAVDDDIDGLIG